jgi:hypothetical protein
MYHHRQLQTPPISDDGLWMQLESQPTQPLLQRKVPLGTIEDRYLFDEALGNAKEYLLASESALRASLSSLERKSMTPLLDSEMSDPTLANGKSVLFFRS